jgi:hypothetical protein
MPTIVPAAAALAVATLAAATLLPALAQSGKRSGVGPCRQGALAIIAMLDGGDDKSADYRHAYAAVTQTCGPVAQGKPASSPVEDRATCRDRALAMLDAIEDGKMNTQGFVRARNRFAQSCAPR